MIMAADKQDKVLNVPTLRFPEFSGEWHRTTIGKCCSPLEYGMNAPAKEYDGKNKYIRITDIDEETCTYKYDDVVSPNALLEEKYKVIDNDILFARTGASTGKAYLYDKKDGLMYYAGFLIRGNVKPDFNSKFVFLQTQTQKYKKWVDVMSIRSGQPGINSQEYSSFKFHLPPSKVEQDKISTLFTLLDVRITTQIRIIEDLKQLRSALYYQIFSNIQGNWVTLKMVGDIAKGKQINGSELLDEGMYYVMNGGITPSGYYNNYNTPANTISISEVGNSCGYVQYNSVPFWSGGHCYNLRIKKSFDSQYIFHFLKFKELDIMALRIGSGLPNIQKKDLEHFQVLVPDFTTQKKVAGLFVLINKKEETEMKLMNAWKMQKKYLLQKLFI